MVGRAGLCLLSDPKRVVYSGGWRITAHYRETRDGYSIVVKEERLHPARVTVYVYHLFVDRRLVVTHAHYKYLAGEPPRRWWLQLQEGTKISLEKLLDLLEARVEAG